MSMSMSMSTRDEQEQEQGLVPIGGRWCGECGGEIRHVRQWQMGRAQIVTFLQCQLCFAMRPILIFDLLSGKDRAVGFWGGGGE